MGTPQFAVPALETLSDSGFRPMLCITQPDKPRGRNQNRQAPEIKLKALDLGIEVLQPEEINSAEVYALLAKLKPHVIITVAYGCYLKKAIRLLPVFGCLNLHPSLLPKYRGSSPIYTALLKGDEVTGNTIFKIVASMDAGPILLQKKTKIKPNDCYTSLYRELSQSGAQDLLEVLQKLETDSIRPIPQNHQEATFCQKLDKKDLWVNWHNSAMNISNQVRALAETPGAVAAFRKARIKIIELEILNSKSEKQPGKIVNVIKNKGIIAASGDKDVLIKRLQPAGKKIMDSFVFSLGARIKNNEHFENGF